MQEDSRREDNEGGKANSFYLWNHTDSKKFLIIESYCHDFISLSVWLMLGITGGNGA